MTKPRLDQGPDYERGFVDGMQYQMQSSVDKAVNRMAQPEQEPVGVMIDLLRRAWDALDSFKQAYPENWHEDDEQVMVDLMRADMKLSSEQPRQWVGLTDEEMKKVWYSMQNIMGWYSFQEIAKAIEAKLKEKNK